MITILNRCILLFSIYIKHLGFRFRNIFIQLFVKLYKTTIKSLFRANYDRHNSPIKSEFIENYVYELLIFFAYYMSVFLICHLNLNVHAHTPTHTLTHAYKFLYIYYPFNIFNNENTSL